MTRSVAVVFACFLAATGTGVRVAQAGGPAPDPAAAQYEVSFLTVMSDHHQMEVDMARTCVDKALHLELRTLCREIVGVESDEIQTMLTWLRDWYGITHEPQTDPNEREKADRMAALPSEDFEIEFMRSMRDHHRRAMVETDRCVDRAYHPELVDLCHGISERQADDVDLMEEWSCDWYRKCS
ncbi:MAG: DUF305 domain-containing protein [Acidimicrobiia bacterium]